MPTMTFFAAFSAFLSFSLCACDQGASGPGVEMGQTVDQVEKVMGPAISVVPNFGNERRVYKAKSGEKYMLTFENGELVQIQN